MSATISMEKKLQTFQTVLYAIFENDFLGPSFPYFCTLGAYAIMRKLVMLHEIWYPINHIFVCNICCFGHCSWSDGQSTPSNRKFLGTSLLSWIFIGSLTSFFANLIFQVERTRFMRLQSNMPSSSKLTSSAMVLNNMFYC